MCALLESSIYLRKVHDANLKDGQKNTLVLEEKVMIKNTAVLILLTLNFPKSNAVTKQSNLLYLLSITQFIQIETLHICNSENRCLNFGR